MNGFNLDKVIHYAKRLFSKASSKGLYMILLMYYAYRNEAVPAWAKRIILGTVAYVVSPIDAIPDLTPFIGMTDDIAVLSAGLVTIASYVDDGVRAKARKKLSEITSKVNDDSLDEVDDLL
jgi:uncharacterized membrane protein YkvA (DUF1232 family)